MGETRSHDSSYVVFNLDRGVEIATRVRIAGTSGARRTGLLGIKKLEAGAGLWITPSEAIHTFGMKTHIDVLFLDKNFRILKAIPSLPPWRVSICLTAHSVLELEPGAIARSGTEPGDRLCLHS